MMHREGRITLTGGAALWAVLLTLGAGCGGGGGGAANNNSNDNANDNNASTVLCGDGVQGGAEECDDGAQNSDA